MTRTLSVLLLPLLVGTACATTGGGSGGGAYDDPITREEFADKGYDTAWEVVQSERPRWLSGRGGGGIEFESYTIVYVNGMRRGSPEELRNIPASAVREIRYYDSRDATMRFGTGHPEGAIEVVM